jgi:GTP cyclohydrolase II
MPKNSTTALPKPGSAGLGADTVSIRAVHAAAAALRRGQPVVLQGHETLLVAAAETLDEAVLGQLGPCALLLMPSVRAEAVLHGDFDVSQAVAALAAPQWDVTALRGLADPTTAQMAVNLRAETVPPDAGAAIALAKLARLLPAMLAASVPQPLPGVLTVDAGDVLTHPDRSAGALQRVAEANVPLEAAPDCRLVAFREGESGLEHLAILVGRPEDRAAPLIRVHSECFTGDVLGSLRCDCGPQLRGAIDRMAAEGAGAVLYLAQEGRGIGLANKLRAYALQDQGLDTLDANRALGFNADERRFLVAAVMLERLGLRRVRLLTNNPDKLAALTACGIEIDARESLLFAGNGVNDRYLATKLRRFGHLPE